MNWVSGDRRWLHSDVDRANAALPAGHRFVPGNLLLVRVVTH